jgi:hypothetical protein
MRNVSGAPGLDSETWDSTTVKLNHCLQKITDPRRKIVSGQKTHRFRRLADHPQTSPENSEPDAAIFEKRKSAVKL